MRNVVEYRSYKIIASDLNGQPQALIYQNKQIVTQERLEAKTLDLVIQKAKSWVDQKVRKDAQNQRAPHIAAADKYAEYLRARNLKKHERAMLLAHAKAQVLTATELASAASWDRYSSANAHYGLLGKKMSRALGLDSPTRDDGTEIWTMALAGAADDDYDGQEADNFRWIIHPELVEGMLLAGVIEQEPEWMRQLRAEH